MRLFKRGIKEPETIPALFLHIQKTAGTSIIDLARQHYGSSITSHGDCWGIKPESLNSINFVSGHIGYDYAKGLMKTRYSFTFLRDPVERVLSMYYFCRGQDPSEFDIYRAANQYDLEDFLHAATREPLIKKNIWNAQVWQLAHGYAHLDGRTISDFEPSELLDLALKHLDDFTHIGFTETFELDRDLILKSLGLPLPKVNGFVNKTLGRPNVADLSDGVIKVLNEITELDQVLYAEAKLRSTKRLK